MILATVELLLFLAVAIAFGYAATRLFLGERKVSLLVPFSVLLGLGGYMFFVNVLSYLIPIRATVWIVLFAFIIFSVYLLLRRGAEWYRPELDLSKKQLRILFGLALLASVISGVVQLRALEHDDYSHLIAAATISAGNFPVMNPMDPDTRFSYHYGPDLLAAAMYHVTDVPLLQDYDTQIFFFTGATFLLAFVLAFFLTEDFLASILAALFFFYAGGLLFLNVVHGFSPLYHRYVLGEPVVGQWKFVADMLWPKLNQFFTYGMRSHTTAMGMPMILAVVYLYLKQLSERKAKIRSALIIGLFLGAIALSLETSFVVLALALALAFVWEAYSFVRGSDPSLKQKHADRMKLTFVVLLVGSIVAVLQGGIITNYVFSGSIIDSGPSFSINSDMLGIPVSSLLQAGEPISRIPILSWTFLKEFGLPLFLFPVALYVFRRDKRILFLSGVGVVAFFLPIFVVFNLTPNAMLRLFSVSTPIFAFVSALLVARLFEEHKERPKANMMLVLTSLIVVYGGLAFQLVSLVTPFNDFGKIHVPFVASLPAPSRLDAEAYDWVPANTAPAARFFPYDPMLMIETGRMSPGNYPALFPADKIPLYDEIVNGCSASALHAFGIDYIVVSPSNFSQADYVQKCSGLDAIAVFSDVSGSDYRYIYKLQD